MKNSQTLITSLFLNYRALLMATFLMVGLYACVSENADDNVQPQTNTTPIGPSCPDSPDIFVNATTGTGCGQNTGSITVTGSGGSGDLTFSLDNTNFQSSGTFENLTAGTFTVIVKDTEGCTNSTTAKVELTEVTSLANQVMPIIENNCLLSGCHVSGGQRPDLSDKLGVINNAQRILARTSDGTMPPTGSSVSLSNRQVELIRCWVQSGAQDN